jgi:hypothetical protein
MKLAIARMIVKTIRLRTVSNASIYNWIKMGRVPNIELAQILADAARLSIDALRPMKAKAKSWF